MRVGDIFISTQRLETKIFFQRMLPGKMVMFVQHYNFWKRNANENKIKAIFFLKQVHMQTSDNFGSK